MSELPTTLPPLKHILSGMKLLEMLAMPERQFRSYKVESIRRNWTAMQRDYDLVLKNFPDKSGYVLTHAKQWWVNTLKRNGMTMEEFKRIESLDDVRDYPEEVIA